MKKILYTALGVLLFILLSTTQGFCRDKTGLYNLFRKKAVTKVYFSPIENLSNSPKADISSLAQKLKEAFKSRKSIKFDIVGSEADSDIIIACDLVTFYWSDKDPIDLIVGVYAIAYDLLTTESYAFQEVVFSVTDTKKKKLLWNKKLKIDLTKKDMTEDESILLINQKTVSTFMRDCFSKRYSKPRR